MTSGSYFADPMGIAVTDDGNVLVSDCEKGCIQMFDDSGKYLGKFGQVDASRLCHPAGELYNVYVLFDHGVQKLLGLKILVIRYQ